MIPSCDVIKNFDHFIAGDPTEELLVDHYGWRAGTVTQAINGLQANSAITAALVKVYAQVLLGRCLYGDSAHCPAGFRSTDIHGSAPTGFVLKPVVETDNPVYLSSGQGKQLRNGGYHRRWYVSKVVLQRMKNRQ
jgi:hypothetical protein